MAKAYTVIGKRHTTGYFVLGSQSVPVVGTLRDEFRARYLHGVVSNRVWIRFLP